MRRLLAAALTIGRTWRSINTIHLFASMVLKRETLMEDNLAECTMDLSEVSDEARRTPNHVV